MLPLCEMGTKWNHAPLIYQTVLKFSNPQLVGKMWFIMVVKLILLFPNIRQMQRYSLGAIAPEQQLLIKHLTTLKDVNYTVNTHTPNIMHSQ